MWFSKVPGYIFDKQKTPYLTEAKDLTLAQSQYELVAYGVFVGVLMASLSFANKISHFMYVENAISEDDHVRTYTVVGQVFFHSASRFLSYFNFKEAVPKVIINVSNAHFWDISAVHALDMAVIKFQREGAEVEVIGLNKASETIVDRFGVHNKPELIDKVIGSH